MLETCVALTMGWAPMVIVGLSTLIISMITYDLIMERFNDR